MAYEFPQVMTPEKFKKFLTELKDIGVPDSFDTKRLKSMGYTSSHDLKYASAIKFIGLVEDKKGGAPTELWKEMRSNFGAAIAKGTRQGYSDLFGQYPDAHKRDAEALTNYFAANSSASSDSLKRIVATFQTFCELGDFSDRGEEHGSASGSSPEAPELKRSPSELNREPNAPTININIQLQLPPDSTGEAYEKFFDAMKTKLFT